MNPPNPNMTCTCIADTEKELTDRISLHDRDKPKGGTLSGVRCYNMPISIRSGKRILTIPFEVSRTGSKKRITFTQVSADYCPFCGGKFQ